MIGENVKEKMLLEENNFKKEGTEKEEIERNKGLKKKQKIFKNIKIIIIFFHVFYKY